MSYFEVLNDINVNEHTEKKNNLTYLSWAWAWGVLKKKYPYSFYTVYENRDGLFYHTDGKTAWVKTGVTVVFDEGELEHIEYLPVMDFRNKSIPIDSITSFDVNKAIQRSLTKAVARHGLGLYIYAGEDLPESEVPVPEPVVYVDFEELKEVKTMLDEMECKEEDVLKKYKLEKITLMTEEQFFEFRENFLAWKEREESKGA